MAQGDLFAGQDYDSLTAAAAKIPAGSEGLEWAPYLLGERTPHLDPLVRAAFAGIASDHTAAHFIRAVLEGVAYSLEDTFTLFAELGIPVKAIRLGGGGARGPLWRKIQAGIYGQAVEIFDRRRGWSLWLRTDGRCGWRVIGPTWTKPARRGSKWHSASSRIPPIWLRTRSAMPSGASFIPR